jgi:hypothetical protein
MTFGEQNPSSLDDDQFERMLFNSARNDELSLDVEAFWTRLNTSIDGVARLSAASAGVGSGSLGGRAYRAVAGKWLILGAIAGSALTALTITGVREHQGTTAPRQQVALAPPNPITSAPESSAEPVREIAPVLDYPSSPSEAPASVPQRRTASARVASPRPDNLKAAAHTQPDSTLGAEVALLDAAQTAVAAGMLGEALRLADQYRTDYPNGELAPEAEVVAIEALAARADRVALATRAAHFLARYPSDPHAARVKWLAP